MDEFLLSVDERWIQQLTTAMANDATNGDAMASDCNAREFLNNGERYVTTCSVVIMADTALKFVVLKLAALKFEVL